MTVAAGATLSAATYYVTPDGAGQKSGADWDNAMGTAELIAQAAANANGDVYYFAAGTYYPTAPIVFKTATGATLYGAEEGRTILSGDANGDKAASDGDLAQIMKFQPNTVDGVTTNLVAINNIDFTGIYAASTSDEATNCALYMDNSGMTKVNNCNFYGNKLTGTRGGSCVVAYRSHMEYDGCNFYDNATEARGSVIRMRSNATTKSFATFANCSFYGNTSGDLGAPIFVQHAMQVNIVNCTIANNSASGRGAAIYINASGEYANALTIIGSTIANNTITGEGGGEQIACAGDGFNLKLADNIIVNPEGSSTIAFKNYGSNDAIVSGGYNYVGEVSVVATDAFAGNITWGESDSQAAANSYAAIFGENVLGDNGVVRPAKFVAGATGEQLTAAVADWGLPTGLPLATDQLGNSRTGNVTPGALAISDSEVTTGIADVRNDGCGLAAPLRVYDMAGRVAATSLDRLPAGIYVVVTPAGTYKIVK